LGVELRGVFVDPSFCAPFFAAEIPGSFTDLSLRSAPAAVLLL
jgi:hypothetical protein